jgi:hypothetical protein
MYQMAESHAFYHPDATQSDMYLLYVSTPLNSVTHTSPLPHSFTVPLFHQFFHSFCHCNTEHQAIN